MAFTFLELTNLALREINEVPMSEQQFNNARGLQQYAKNAVNKAYFDVSAESTEWPWKQKQAVNTANTTVTQLNAGQVWYDINPLLTDNNQEVLWDTFLITDKDLVVNDPLVKAELVRKLPYITYEEWNQLHRENDFDGQNAAVPQRIVRHPTGKFGVSPAPDKTYWLEYNLLSETTRFVDPLEEVPFPEDFSNVLAARSAYYLWKFRENFDQANASNGEYKEALTSMKRIVLSNKQDRIRLR